MQGTVLDKVVTEGHSDEVTFSRDLNAEEQVIWKKVEQVLRGSGMLEKW